MRFLIFMNGYNSLCLVHKRDVVRERERVENTKKRLQATTTMLTLLLTVAALIFTLVFEAILSYDDITRRYNDDHDIRLIL